MQEALAKHRQLQSSVIFMILILKTSYPISAFQIFRTSIEIMERNHHRSFKKVKRTTEVASEKESQSDSDPPLYICEGVFAVSKPLEWTSSDVVTYIRKMLERDAKERGFVEPPKRGRKPLIKCGHGGTLDPLATGVLVIGVGKGTKHLQSYLSGAKRYRAGVRLGIQTTTLDLDPTAQIVQEKPFGHVTKVSIEQVLPQFTGKIMQVPPLFSALRKDGKRLHEQARSGKTEADVEIEPRQVEIFDLKLLTTIEQEEGLPGYFGLDVDCGGGTYIRSLVRDIGHKLDTVATMSSLVRTKQGVFETQHCLCKADWTPEKIYDAIEKSSRLLLPVDAGEKGSTTPEVTTAT